MDSQFRSRLKRDSNPVYRFSSPRVSSGVGLVRQVQARPFSLLRLFFRIHRFRVALQAQRTAERRPSIGPALAEYRLVESRIRYKNGPARCEWSEWHHGLCEVEKGYLSIRSRVIIANLHLVIIGKLELREMDLSQLIHNYNLIHNRWRSIWKHSSASGTSRIS